MILFAARIVTYFCIGHIWKSHRPDYYIIILLFKLIISQYLLQPLSEKQTAVTGINNSDNV